MKRRILIAIPFLVVVAAVIGTTGDAAPPEKVVIVADKLTRFCPVNPSQEQAARMERDFQKRRTERQAEGLSNVTGGTVDVYWHTITSSTGAGALSPQAINNQISVLNAAYGNSFGWSFRLVQTDVTANTTWYNGCYGSSESAMKNALRKGTADDLNIYSCNPSRRILGYSTFASHYTRT